MEKIYYSMEEDGFYGAYWPCRKDTGYCIIGQFGDNIDDPLAKCGVRYFHDFGLNVMTFCPAKGDYSFRDFPLEVYGKVIDELKRLGNRNIGITGASTVGMSSLLAASYYPDITFTLAFTPSDWVMEGYCRDGLDDCPERPGNGSQSTFSWKGEPIPFLPFPLRHPDYWHFMERNAKEKGDRIRSIEMFDLAEEKAGMKEEWTIKTERIKGLLVLIGAEDDALWDTCRYMRRIGERLQRMPHDSEYEIHCYGYGTHFIFPEGLWKKFFPGTGALMSKIMFRSAKEHPKECKATRVDVDRVVKRAVKKWMAGAPAL